MHSLKERLLDGLVFLFVIISILLSSRIWFPADPGIRAAAKEARVEAQPAGVDRRMPDLFRPERILVKRRDGAVAVLQMGTGPYNQAWALSQSVLTRLRPAVTLAASPESDEEAVQTDAITLLLPAPLRLSEWSEHWNWNSFGFSNLALRMDRVTFETGKRQGVYMAGPLAGAYRASPLTESEIEAVSGLVNAMDKSLFFSPRRLNIGDLSVRALRDVWVPNAQTMPLGGVRPQKPIQTVEEARFFPDLSVVREIQEQGATSFTDGQRLLRLAGDGILEYRTADIRGYAPELFRGIAYLQEWVAQHGGWPQDLVLTRFAQDSGKARFQFDLRMQGPYPVETVGGALLIDLISVDRVTYLKRFPDFVSVTFTKAQVSIISPEEALKSAIDPVPAFLFEPIRHVEPVFLLQLQGVTGQFEWSLEPAWLFLVGDGRVYVPARSDLGKRQPLYIR